MREIKFRGKNDFNDEWYYGYLFLNKTEDGYCVGYLHDYADVIESTVGQFTGLKDSEGREIYEGDIVAFKDNETDEYTRGVVLQSVLGTWLVVFEGLSVSLWNVRKTALILSNIHDSPEFWEAINARD